MGFQKKSSSRKTILYLISYILLMSGTAADKKSPLPKHTVQHNRHPVRTRISGNTSTLILIVKKLTFGEIFSAVFPTFYTSAAAISFFLLYFLTNYASFCYFLKIQLVCMKLSFSRLLLCEK
jgi:hypothetical protein